MSKLLLSLARASEILSQSASPSWQTVKPHLPHVVVGSPATGLTQVGHVGVGSNLSGSHGWFTWENPAGIVIIAEVSLWFDRGGANMWRSWGRTVIIAFEAPLSVLAGVTLSSIWL